ncbi:MAG: UDP-glucose dehydrogenase family protein [Bacteroidota bacterium]
MSYDLGVIGTGYVGLVSGTCFAATGNNVYCVDIVEEKIKNLKKGICPIFEPGLEHLLHRNQREGRLHFTTSLEMAVENSNIIFLCLPTPPSEDGSADLQHVLKVAADIARIIKEKNITDKRIVVNKSTVPVGTGARVQEIFDRELPEGQVMVASNPEFLREGFAVDDAMKPERVVVGTNSEYVEEIMRDLYEPFVRSGNPVLVMDIKSAEVTKYAANSFLATKISFVNDLSEYCEKVGADIEKIRMGIGSDSRIGKRFLFAGIGFGGSCFPKDVRALIHSSEQEGIELEVIKAAQEVNHHQIMRFFEKIKARFDGNLKGKRIAIWGLAFKPNTDDTREAPAFLLIDRLLEAGARVSAYDPEAMPNTQMRFKDAIEYGRNMYDCAEGADALVVATEWTVFRKPDFDKLSEKLAGKIVFDGRNLYNLEEMEEMGYEYYCIGRKSSRKLL